MIYIYYLLSILAISSVFTMIYQNQFFRMVWLIITFLNSAFLLILLDFNYIGLSYIIIYIGAIIILFLFVILMINEDPILRMPSTSKYILISISLVLFFSLSISIDPQFNHYFTDNFFTSYLQFNDIQLIANMIYVHYPLVLFLIGYLLLILLIGILKLLL